MNGLSFSATTEKRKGILLDPRTKLILLLTITTLMFSTSNEGIMNIVKPCLSLVPFALILSERRFKTAGKYLVLYAVCFILERIALTSLSGLLSFIVLAVTSIMTRFAPGIMTGAYLISSTSISEFIGAMERMHITEKIVIPMSVIFRFFPTISEEYQAIRDAMKMRGIRFGGKNPFLMLEYRLVPLMVSVVKIGDELSAAALTRGLGAPVKRTNVCQIGFHVQDLIAILFCVICFALFLFQQHFFLTGGGEPMIRIDHVTFSYGEENENAGGVHDINLTVEDGQCVVLCGESGSGKTTITRLINGLIPHYYEGKMNGEVWVNGAKVSEQPLYDTAKTVGSVFQNPRSQFFNVDTTSEITFGCENLGQPEQSIRERLDKTIRDFRLEKLMGRNIFHLSGGEKQKIACAGVSIMEPDVLVMDEPSSNLDASSILDLRAILAFWKSQGKTIIVSEHRLYYLRGLADRFIYITGGKVEKDYSAAEFESLTEQQRAKLGLRTFILEDLLPPKALPQAGQQMELRNFCFAYKNEPETLHIRESKIPANRIVGIIGNNGAGKSTFSRCFCGLEKRCGEVIWNGRTYRPKDRLNTCYMVMQEVNHQLFTETVLDEVLISMEEENQEWAEEILAELDLIGFKDRHPMSLSGGQKQRVAIASAIASKRSILFFDEPTSGLDYKHMKEVANVLKQVRDAGITLYVITHDLELLLDCCTDIVHFEDGSIIDKFQMDEAGLEKIRNYFIKGVPTK
jgi:energy-coupling factor transport system ATP-binding protein